MTQPAVPGSANWQRQWTIDAGDVLLQPVTRRIAEDVLAGGPITRTFETGALHNRIPQTMSIAIRDLQPLTGCTITHNLRKSVQSLFLLLRGTCGRMAGTKWSHVHRTSIGTQHT